MYIMEKKQQSNSQLMNKNRKKRIVKENLSAWAFLAPYIIIFIIFFIIPFFYSMYISLHDWDMFNPSRTQFVGLDNFRRILFDDTSIFFQYFWQGIKNTLLFVLISVPLLIGIPLGLAVLL